MIAIGETDEPASEGPRPSVGSTADKLRGEGRRLASETRAEAEKLANERKHAAGGFLQDMGIAVSTASGEMRSKGHRKAASFIDTTAEEIARLGREIDEREIADLVREVETFARRRPAVFFGASLIAGFAAMRFLKASADATEDRASPNMPVSGS